MSNSKPIKALAVDEVFPKTIYPKPFSLQMEGRTKRKLGDQFGLTNYGINFTQLQPGAISALKHHHKLQDEFIYIITGNPTLIYGDDEYIMNIGDCFGFPKGVRLGHQLINRTNELVEYLEIGDRTLGDEVEYPNDDICAKSAENGSWKFYNKNGDPYK